jgi:hypothetical protein
MTLQTSQTVPEKTEDWVSNHQDQVPNDRACDRKNNHRRKGVQELQEFRR